MANQIEEAANSFYTAMKGLGTDEKRIIREICQHSNRERQHIKQKYLTMFGHALEDDLKSEISGNFLKAMLGLLTPTVEYEAQCLRYAMKGLGTNEKTLIEIICPKGPDEIRHLTQVFNTLYNRNLQQDLASELSGELKRVFQSLSSGSRDTDCAVNYELAQKEAQELYDAGQGRIGTDEIQFIRILCSRSFAQLLATFERYYSISKCDIEPAIKKEMSGYLERALLAIVKSIRNKPAYFAEQLYESMKDLGTNDEALIRLLVCRSEIDLPAIKHEYKRMYGKSLHDAVKSETSGDYEKLLLTLIGKD